MPRTAHAERLRGQLMTHLMQHDAQEEGQGSNQTS